jgi:integrase
VPGSRPPVPVTSAAVPALFVAAGGRAPIRFLEFRLRFATHTRDAPMPGCRRILAWCTDAGLRYRALIGLMVYSFARIGAALGMAVEDVYTQNRRLWIRQREKGGRRHAMPSLEECLVAYLDGVGLRNDPKGPLFRTIGRDIGKFTRTVPQANAYAMIRRRTVAAGIATKLGNHSFRATGITAYLKNRGTLENAAAMANHASTRTTQLYDRRRDELSLNEVERITI